MAHGESYIMHLFMMTWNNQGSHVWSCVLFKYLHFYVSSAPVNCILESMQKLKVIAKSFTTSTEHVHDKLWATYSNHMTVAIIPGLHACDWRSIPTRNQILMSLLLLTTEPADSVITAAPSLRGFVQHSALVFEAWELFASVENVDDCRLITKRRQSWLLQQTACVWLFL